MDFELTDTGDLFIDGNNINRLTVEKYLGQRIHFILRSKMGDWAQHPDRGANIAQYVGYPNLPATKELIEEEVSDELERDNIIGNFHTRVIYTPTSSTTGLIEVRLYLNENEYLDIKEELNTVGSSMSGNGEQYTPPEYNLNTEIVRSEIIEQIETTNIFELKYMPSTRAIFIVPFTEELDLDEDGLLYVAEDTAYQHTDVTDPAQKIYPLSGELTSVITSGLVTTIEATRDEIQLESDEYGINDQTVSFDTAPSGEFEIFLNYYDTYAISNVVGIAQDSHPENIFPRSHITDRYVVTTRNIFDPGTYLVQYTTHPLE